MRTTAYRYPNERLVLGVTLLLVLMVIALTATATLCASFVFMLLFILYSFSLSKSQHQALMQTAERMTARNMPGLAEVARRGMQRLQPENVEIFVAPSSILNAYTFGLSSPRVVVLYSALLETMDAEELLFIIGHEFGHVVLGHTWLNSVVGGMAGIPAPGAASALLTMAFLWWNRMCEFSADRAGLLACGKPEKAITALVKLAAGPGATSQAALEKAYQRIDAEDDTFLGSLNEALATHPMLIRRVQELRQYARSPQYRRLQAQLNQGG